jgi:hypothetical protein
MTTNANTTIYDSSVDRAAMIRLYEQSAAGKVMAVIDGHEVRIAELIAMNKAKMTPALRELIDKELKATFVEMHSVSSRSLLDLARDQISYMYQSIDNTIGKVWRTARPSNRIAEEIVLQRPLHKDTTLSSGWRGISVAEKLRIEQEIRRGISLGHDEKQIALNIRKSNVFKITRTQSLGLARTAMTSVYAQADQEVYKANE